MVKLTVKIVSMQDADKFNKLCSKFNCDMDLQSGKYYVDAKSIMGIFSLDLSKPLILNADTDDEELIKETLQIYRRGIIMTRTLKERTFPEQTNPEIQPWEIEHRKTCPPCRSRGHCSSEKMKSMFSH